MNNPVTIKTFTYSYEIGIPKSKLESEGIPCFVKNELISQVYPANAVGGIQLQVREEDVERAIAVLKEGGYIQNADLEPSGFQVKMYRIFSKIPLLKKIYRNT